MIFQLGFIVTRSEGVTCSSSKGVVEKFENQWAMGKQMALWCLPASVKKKLIALKPALTFLI